MKTNNKFQKKKILVICCGSIAAVKTPILVSNLIKKGAEVKCVVTPSASNLVSPLSLATLSRNRCYQDENQWDPKESKPLHIALSEWADFIVVAPLTASSLSRWVKGNGEGLAASILLAAEKPIIAAAAMNTSMWENQFIRKNWGKLQELPNIISLNPSEGLLACDRIGDGRMADPELIQLAIENASIQIEKYLLLKKDWKGLHLLITTGPTIENLDAARYLSNRSSGKMGVLLGQAARFRGAEVSLIHGPLKIQTALLEGMNTFAITTAEDLRHSLETHQPKANAIAMASAVSDLRSKKDQTKIKIPKHDLLANFNERLEVVPDLLTQLNDNRKEDQVILGFTALAGEEDEIKTIALSKKNLKGCDLLMANPIDKIGQGFGSEFNEGWLLGPENQIKKLSFDSKLKIAHELLDNLRNILVGK